MAGGSAVAAAALVLPDRWLRMTFVHLEDVPRNARQRQEALRFKLRKQVPFRVEELRVRGAETEAGRGESARFLIAFCVERVVAQVEDSFRRNGIHIGLVTNASLSAAHGIRQVYGEDGASLLFLARPDGYALLAHAGNGPAFYRYKNLDPALPAPVVTRRVVRELRMTKSFSEERELFGPEGALPEHTLLLASESTRGPWSERLEAGLGLEALAFQSNGRNNETFPSGPDSPDLPPELFLPMLGASLSVTA